jgi:site-specific recombinase XerD
MLQHQTHPRWRRPISAAPALVSLAHFCRPDVFTWRRRTCLPRTVRAYSDDGVLLVRFLTVQGMPTVAASIRGEHVEAFIAAELERAAPSSAATRCQSLQQLFKWLADEGEISASPMAKTRPPKIPEKTVPVLADDDAGVCWLTARVRTSAIGATSRSSGCSWTPACG